MQDYKEWCSVCSKYIEISIAHQGFAHHAFSLQRKAVPSRGPPLTWPWKLNKPWFSQGLGRDPKVFAP